VPQVLIEEIPVEVPQVQIAEVIRQEAQAVMQEVIKEVPKAIMQYLEKVVEISQIAQQEVSAERSFAHERSSCQDTSAVNTSFPMMTTMQVPTCHQVMSSALQNAERQTPMGSVQAVPAAPMSSVSLAAGPIAPMGTAGSRRGATARFAAPLRQTSANLPGRPELNISGASSGSGSAVIANGSMVNVSNISRGSVSMMTPGMAPMQVGVGGMTPVYTQGPGCPAGPLVMESVSGVRGVGIRPVLAQGSGMPPAAAHVRQLPMAAAPSS